MKSCIGNTYKCSKGADGDLSIAPRSRATRTGRGKTKTHKELASQMRIDDSAFQKDPDDSFALVDFGDAMETRESKAPGGGAVHDLERLLPEEPAHAALLAEAPDPDAMTSAQARKGTF